MKIKFSNFCLIQDKDTLGINKSIYLLKFIIFNKRFHILLLISGLDNRIEFFISDNLTQNRSIRSI